MECSLSFARRITWCTPVLALLVCLSPIPVRAQAANVGRALIDAINSGDSLRIQRWADSSWLPSIYPRYRESIYRLYRLV